MGWKQGGIFWHLHVGVFILSLCVANWLLSISCLSTKQEDETTNEENPLLKDTKNGGNGMRHDDDEAENGR